MPNFKIVILLVILILLMGVVGLLLSQSGLTGGTILKTTGIACHQDSDCNDNIPQTVDSCKNKGTEYSLCINKPNKN